MGVYAFIRAPSTFIIICAKHLFSTFQMIIIVELVFCQKIYILERLCVRFVHGSLTAFETLLLFD